jgi:hypothetical protein
VATMVPSTTTPTTSVIASTPTAAVMTRLYIVWLMPGYRFWSRRWSGVCISWWGIMVRPRIV